MSVIYAVLGTIAYALQNALLASMYRKCDRYLVILGRNLSLSITMLPVLLLVDRDGIIPPAAPWIEMAVSGVTGFLGLVALAEAMKHLSVGVCAALSTCILAVTTIVLEMVLTNESISLSQLGLIAVILAFASRLALERSSSVVSASEPRAIGRGAFLAVLSGVMHGATFFTFGLCTRHFHPLAAGYFLELGVGITACAAVGLRALAKREARHAQVSARKFFKIAVFSSPTIAGTSLFALANATGQISVATAIISSQPVFASILGFLFYGERLSARQISALLGVCGAVAGLHFLAA